MDRSPEGNRLVDEDALRVHQTDAAGGDGIADGGIQDAAVGLAPLCRAGMEAPGTVDVGDGMAVERGIMARCRIVPALRLAPYRRVLHWRRAVVPTAGNGTGPDQPPVAFGAIEDVDALGVKADPDHVLGVAAPVADLVDVILLDCLGVIGGDIVGAGDDGHIVIVRPTLSAVLKPDLCGGAFGGLENGDLGAGGNAALFGGEGGGGIELAVGPELALNVLGADGGGDSLDRLFDIDVPAIDQVLFIVDGDVDGKDDRVVETVHKLLKL